MMMTIIDSEFITGGYSFVIHNDTKRSKILHLLLSFVAKWMTKDSKEEIWNIPIGNALIERTKRSDNNRASVEANASDVSYILW